MSDAPSSEMSGVRASTLVLLGVGGANFANYLFHLLSARYLGPASYGDVATLSAVAAIIGLPLGGAQFFVARHVAAATARGRAVNDDGYVSGFAGAMLLAGGALTVVLLVLSPLIQRALSIGSLWSVVFTVLFTAPAFVTPVLIGTGQGAQRFLLVAVAFGVAPIVRVFLVAACLAAGFGVVGAMASTFVASMLAVAIPWWLLRSSLGRPRDWRARLSRRDGLALLPVIAGMLAITVLSTDDLVVAKAAFNAHQAGLYGSASLIGRIILYLPVAIVTVLLPKVSARVSAERETTSILVQSLLGTAAFCALATLVYAVVPHLIVRIAFGAKYQGAASLLWLFGIAMSFYALINVLFAYQLGRGATRLCWLLLAGAVVQAGVFAAFHGTPRELLGADIAIAAVLLVLTIAGLPELSRRRT